MVVLCREHSSDVAKGSELGELQPSISKPQITASMPSTVETLIPVAFGGVVEGVLADQHQVTQVGLEGAAPGSR